MRQAYFVAIVTFVLSVSGCASTPNPPGEKFSEPVLVSSESSVLYFYRHDTKRSGYFNVGVYVDGKPAVALGPDTYAFIEVTPGTHTIMSNADIASFHLYGEHRGELEFTASFEAGKTYYIPHYDVVKGVSDGFLSSDTTVSSSTKYDFASTLGGLGLASKVTQGMTFGILNSDKALTEIGQTGITTSTFEE